ncbi:MAG: Yip1 family protein [Archaeoglobaceae archaeon]
MDIIFNPDKFLSSDPGWLKASVVVAIVVAISLYNASVLAEPMAEATKQLLLKMPSSNPEVAESFARSTIAVSLVGAVAGPIITWLVIYAGITYVVAAVLGGRGKFTGLLRLTAFAFVPTIVLAPVNVYYNHHYALMLEEYGAQAIGAVSTPMAIISLANSLWAFVYLCFAAKHAMGISTKRAAVAAAVPTLLVSAGSIFSLIFAETLLQPY